MTRRIVLGAKLVPSRFAKSWMSFGVSPAIGEAPNAGKTCRFKIDS